MPLPSFLQGTAEARQAMHTSMNLFHVVMLPRVNVSPKKKIVVPPGGCVCWRQPFPIMLAREDPFSLITSISIECKTKQQVDIPDLVIIEFPF